MASSLTLSCQRFAPWLSSFITAILCGAFLSALPSPAGADLRVVTTLPVYKSIAEEIGGSAITATSLMHPGADPHSFEPRASDVLQLQRSDLFIHTGLDMELWKEPMLAATDRKDFGSESAHILDLSLVVNILEKPNSLSSLPQSTEMHARGNPHYWLDPENGRAIGRSIAQRLVVLCPTEKERIKTNLQGFEKEIDDIAAEVRRLKETLNGKKVLVYHDDWIYLVGALGINIPVYIESKAGVPPTPSHIKLVRQLLSDHSVLFIIKDVSMPPNGMAENLAVENDVPLLTLAQQPGELAGTDTYEMFMLKNLRLIASATEKN